MTGEVIRSSKQTATRYERDRPGGLVHVDVKKIGKIPDGGGWRALGRAATVLHRHHHRCRARGGDGGDQRVEATHLGVAEPGALLGVPVDLNDHVVDIDQHPPARAAGDDLR